MPERCFYCGNNPISHRSEWVNKSFLVLMTPVNRLVTKSWLGRVVNKLLDRLTGVWWGLLHRLGFAQFHTDVDTWPISRAKVLWEEARARGIPMAGGVLFGRSIDFYRASVNGKDIYFSGLPRPDGFRDSEVEMWVDDKAVLKDKLLAAGVPVPLGGCYSDLDAAVQRFHELEKPVIIKPRRGSRGRHTTTFIYSENDFRKAFATAKQLCYWVIVEEHLVGPVYRGTTIGGKLSGVLGGSPPQVTGNGVASLRELVQEKDRGRDPRVKEVKITPLTDEFLARQGLTMDSVLPAGKTLDMTEKIGLSYGGSSFEVTDETHPGIRAALEQAAAVVGDPLLGFDFIIEDIAASPEGQKWGIIECNGMPFINLHHDPLIGKSNNVAGYVWDLHKGTKA